MLVLVSKPYDTKSMFHCNGIYQNMFPIIVQAEFD